MCVDTNLENSNDEKVIAYYAKKTELQSCELQLFERHLKRGMAILDLGVGGGRTTPYLSSIAGDYVGADYSEGMVAVCRKRFPNLEFRHCDATDMRQFTDDEFDAVVFSFNGIDYIRSDEARARCLSETARVLRPGGIFIVSSHNARALGVWPSFLGARGLRVPWRIIRCVFKSARLAARNLSSGVYRAGEGYVYDPIHGGIHSYMSTPATMAPQLVRAGFEIVDNVSGSYPNVHISALTPWYYYACRKV